MPTLPPSSKRDGCCQNNTKPPRPRQIPVSPLTHTTWTWLPCRPFEKLPRPSDRSCKSLLLVLPGKTSFCSTQPSPKQQETPPLSQHAQPIPSNTLQYPDHARSFLEPYLPTHLFSPTRLNRPHVTITYASSLDSRIALLIQNRMALDEVRRQFISIFYFHLQVFQ